MAEAAGGELPAKRVDKSGYIEKWNVWDFQLPPFRKNGERIGRPGPVIGLVGKSKDPHKQRRLVWGTRQNTHSSKRSLSGAPGKYIGETEKNLHRIFDEAQASNAILFFDEADALFGKRSEVKDSHDRYANIEINFLLQRLEGFQGLAVIATNDVKGIDAALKKRFDYVVRFGH